MDFYKNLSERKKRILNAVITSYIQTAVPVSSSELKEKYFSDISSATIRSELAALEEMGYLYQPHTSAGRIPSSAAYKTYVDNMMTGSELTDEETGLIASYFDGGMYAVEDIIRRTAKVISDVTNYTSVIVLNDVADVKIRKIEMVDVGDDRALVVIVTDGGVISNKTVALPKGMPQGFLPLAVSRLNNVFGGKHLRDVEEVEELIDDEMHDLQTVVKQILTIIKDYRNRDDKVLLAGEEKIFEHPEYNSSIDETKNFLSIISQKDKLREIITTNDNIEFSLNIGGDKDDGLEHCAIVTAKYSIGGKDVGQAGVIGPERMDYKKIKAVLEYVAKLLNTVTK